MIPSAIVRAVSARMREITGANGPTLADLTDLQPIPMRHLHVIDGIAEDVLWLKDNGWGQR